MSILDDLPEGSDHRTVRTQDYGKGAEPLFLSPRSDSRLISDSTERARLMAT